MIRGAVLLLALAAVPAQAQTGKDLFAACSSSAPIQRSTCLLYVSGFVHGMQASQNLGDRICLPSELTGEEASAVFLRVLRKVGKGIVQGTPESQGGNPFFTGPQNASLAAALGLQFKCSQK